MAVTALKMKVMPESPETNMDKLKKEIEASLIKTGAIKIISVETEEIAFGLKALIITIAWPETLDTAKAEDACKISNVSSVEIIDYRRAFG